MPVQVTQWSDAMLTSLAAAMALLFSAIPKIIGFGLILVAGWFIASLIEKGLAAILRSIRFNHMAERAGLTDFVQRMGMNTDPSGMVGLVVKWFVRLGLAFGLGGRETAGEILRKWYVKAQENKGQMRELAENMGDQVRAEDPAHGPGKWPTGGYPQGGGMPGGPVPAEKRHEAEGG